MKALIFRYHYNNNSYYVEGYVEEEMRACLEKHLGIELGTLKQGIKPDVNRELKLIWNPKITTHKLTLNKEQTTDRSKLHDYKKKQHCLYELDLFLKQDESFLNGVNDIIITDPINEVEMWYRHGPSSSGYAMCYSFKGSKKPEATNLIYRFKSISAAYHYMRSELIKNGLADSLYKNKQITCLEMCDSFIAGFGNPDLARRKGSDVIFTKSISNNSFPIELVSVNNNV